MNDSKLRTGSLLMLLGALSFIGYGIIFLFRALYGSGFELGVDTLNGATQAELNALNSAIVPYITHLHIATAGFIAATGIAVAALAHYGVREGKMWAWIAAVISPVVGLAAALPMHYLGVFTYNWITHLGPIYIGTLIFVVGALYALPGLLQTEQRNPL